MSAYLISATLIICNKKDENPMAGNISEGAKWAVQEMPTS